MKINNIISQHVVAESIGNVGAQIKSVYQRILNQGDDAVEFAYYDSPIFAQYWDEYEGDLDSIIAEVEPSELQIILDELQSAAEDQDLNEFAPPGSGDSGDDGFSEETLKRLAAQWYNGDEDSRVERTLMAAGWEIGQDEGYDDEPGVFVVQSGDVNGNSYLSWPAHELKQGMAEGYSLGKVLSLPELLGQIKHILAAKHPGIGWRMTMPVENTFLFSAKNDYDVWSMLVVEPGGDDWVAVGHGMVDPDGKPIIFDRQQLPMTLASASEIADEAIQTYHDIDLSDYADDEDYNQGVAEGKPSKPEPPEADYGPEYQDMVSRVKKLAGLGPLRTVYDPNKRVYKNVPTAVQPGDKK